MQPRDQVAVLVFNKIEFFLKEFTLKMEFTSQRRETFLFLTTNMAVVMSRANQQWTKERGKGEDKFRPVYSVRESRFRNQGNICLWNPEYRSRNRESS